MPFFIPFFHQPPPSTYLPRSPGWQGSFCSLGSLEIRDGIYGCEGSISSYDEHCRLTLIINALSTMLRVCAEAAVCTSPVAFSLSLILSFGHGLVESISPCSLRCGCGQLYSCNHASCRPCSRKPAPAGRNGPAAAGKRIAIVTGANRNVG